MNRNVEKALNDACGVPTGGRGLRQALGLPWATGSIVDTVLGRRLHQDFGVAVPPVQGPVPEALIANTTTPAPAPAPGILAGAVDSVRNGIGNVGRRFQVDVGAPGPGLFGDWQGPGVAPVAAPIGSSIMNGVNSVRNAVGNTIG